MVTLIGYDADSIREGFDDGSWARGLNYYHRGYIHDLVQEDDELYALCEGSRPQPYTVSVQLGPRGFGDAHCSCPIGEYGDCKHVVALMLTYLNRRETMPEIEPSLSPAPRSLTVKPSPPERYHYMGEAEVAALSHDELVALVGRLIMAEPGLVALLPLPPLPDPAAGPADEAELRRLIALAITRRVQRYGIKGDGLRELEELAIAYLEAGDGASATLVYGLLAEAMLRHDPSASVRYGDPLWRVYLTSFCDYFSRLEAPEPRLKLVRLFLSFLAVSPASSGRKSEEIITQAIRATLRPDEMAALIQHAEALLDLPRSQLRQRARNLFRRLELNLGQELLPIESLVKRCLETRQYQPLVARIAEEGALEIMAGVLAERGEGFPPVVLAEVFRRGWGNRLIPAVEKGLFIHIESALSEVKIPGNELLPEAVAVALLRRETGVWHTMSLRAGLLQAGLWHRARPAFEARLEALGRFDLLIDLALRDQDAEAALRWVDRLPSEDPSFDAPYWRRMVARAAAKDFPHEALLLYAEETEALIAGRSRAKYREAAEILVVMRDIYRRIKQPDVFRDYIAALRAEYARLSALQQELDNVRL